MSSRIGIPGRRRQPLRACLLLGLLVVACAGTPSRPHDTLTAGAEPLRSHFNRDQGHTRVVILAAPT